MPRPATALATALLLLPAACRRGDDDPGDTDVGDTDVDATEVAVTVTVHGLGGPGLVLELDGDEALPIAADGTYAFERVLARGDTYEVAVASDPSCPARRICTVDPATASGTAGSGDVVVRVDCEAPAARLYAYDVPGPEVRITDDVASLGADAAPSRTIAGDATTLDAIASPTLAVDPGRDLLYVADSDGIAVFEHASTADGDVAPARIVVPTGWALPNGLAIDPVRDRLYVTGSSTNGLAVAIYDGASTLDGAATPDALLDVHAIVVAVDAAHDRLYAGAGYLDPTLWVFDDASTLTSDDLPDRTVTFPWAEHLSAPNALAVDACTDRLVLGTTEPTPDGDTVLMFDDASTLDGDVGVDDAVARWAGGAVANVATDDAGRLFALSQGGTSVAIVDGATTAVGAIEAEAKQVVGVVDNAVGMAVTTE